MDTPLPTDAQSLNIRMELAGKKHLLLARHNGHKRFLQAREQAHLQDLLVNDPDTHKLVTKNLDATERWLASRMIADPKVREYEQAMFELHREVDELEAMLGMERDMRRDNSTRVLERLADKLEDQQPFDRLVAAVVKQLQAGGTR